MRILRYTDAAYADALCRLNRRAEASDRVRDVVAAVIADIRQNGDKALLELTQKFDGATLTAEQLVVSTEEVAAAVASLTPEVRAALDASLRNVTTFAHQSLRKDWSMINEQGAEVEKCTTPLSGWGSMCPGARLLW